MKINVLNAITYDVVDNANLDKLSKLNLIAIDLTSSNFDDIGAENLTQCKHLQHARLRHTNITDKGLAKLTALKELKFLELADTKVTEKGLPAIFARKFTPLGLIHLAVRPITEFSRSYSFFTTSFAIEEQRYDARYIFTTDSSTSGETRASASLQERYVLLLADSEQRRPGLGDECA
jgi:hypothetical protein